MCKKVTNIFAVALVAVFCVQSLKADLLAYEGFDYTHGTLLRLVGDEGGFGWDGAWTASNDKIAVRTGATLSYTDAFGIPLPVEGLGLHIERTYRTGGYCQIPSQNPAFTGSVF